ncbi:MAG: leucine-rich repeat domain-containing protein [Oscillospiraceae bacterium]|nr:leucine-rich repeat domain-containing protein [Oscillospiraceae bacterium]
MNVQQEHFVNAYNRSQLFSITECPDHIELVRYLTTDLSIVEVPETLCGKPVTVICDACFFAHKELEYVTFHSGLETIGDSAFAMCRQLKELNLPDTVTQIGPRAFRDCKGLKKIVLPSRLETISTGLFSFCYFGSTVDIRLPKQLRRIQTHAFYSCSMLTLNIPDSVTEIDTGAFCGCPKIEISRPIEKGWFMEWPYMEKVCDKKGRTGSIINIIELQSGCKELTVQFENGTERFFYPCLHEEYSFCNAHNQKIMQRERNELSDAAALFDQWQNGMI